MDGNQEQGWPLDSGPGTSTSKPLRVIVIGAGFGGLSAARTLQTHAPAISVTVLEASSYAGGRACTGELPSGTLVEMGATWFHGVRDNPVYDMAVWQGVVKDCRCDPEAQKHEIDWQLHFARPNESQLLQGELKTVAMEAVGRYTEAAEECTQGAQLGDGSVGDVLRRAFDEVVAAEGLKGEALNTFADAWHFREKLQRTFDGFFSTDDVSLAFAREYESLEGPNMPIPGGCQGLANILAQGLDIQFNHAAACIEYGPGGARVTCANGAVFDCDCVLITTSLGVLQANHATLFRPPLPQWKVDAMAALRIGVADKLFVEFEIARDRAKEAAVWLTTHASASPTHSSSGYATGTGNGNGAGTGNNGSALLPGPSPQSAPIGATLTPSPEHPSLASLRATSSPGNLSAPPTQEPLPGTGPTSGIAASIPTEATSRQQQLQQQQRQGAHAVARAGSNTCASEDSTSTSAGTALVASRTAAAAAAAAAAAPAAATGTHTLPASQWGGMGWRNIPSGTGFTDSLSKASPTGAGTQAGAAGSAAGAAAAPPSQQSQRGRRRKHKRAIHSYAFLWPVADPGQLGAMGHPALTLGVSETSARERPVCCDELQLAPLRMVRPPAPQLALPGWMQGLHSIRYCPGPEWIQPSLLQEASAAAAAGKRTSNAMVEQGKLTPTVNLVDGGATHVSGVLWITGHAALAMESASEAELQAGVTSLFQLFPQVPIPPGAILPPKVVRTNWGTNPHHLGSYTYINVGEQTGDAVDALAEPLCNDHGVPIVLFAGEATHRQYIGTVHGAFLSGCREAERLLDLLRANSPSLAGTASFHAQQQPMITSHAVQPDASMHLQGAHLQGSGAAGHMHGGVGWGESVGAAGNGGSGAGYVEPGGARGGQAGAPANHLQPNGFFPSPLPA